MVLSGIDWLDVANKALSALIAAGVLAGIRLAWWAYGAIKRADRDSHAALDFNRKILRLVLLHQRVPEADGQLLLEQIKAARELAWTSRGKVKLHRPRLPVEPDPERAV